MDEIINGEWEYKGRTEHEINCHIQEIPENGADIAHLNYLHLAGVNNGSFISHSIFASSFVIVILLKDKISCKYNFYYIKYVN